ncbi:methyltransferase [Sphaerisporangium sp. NPDC051011]|uniref:methyltransferase n=1 Tax=Sphaerisporangium sp. NPDC051011 TaxID=3155792 RepID=UPI0033C11667
MTYDNSWMSNSAALVEAYAQHNDGVLGMLRQRLLARALEAHMAPWPQRVIDVGGGAGYQAIELARAGHDVVLLDPDPAMLRAAEERLAAEDAGVRGRVRTVLGYGEDAPSLVGEGGFDVVCCHGILMYLPEPAGLLRVLTRLAAPGGLLSVLAINREAIAMRPAMRGRWADALAGLESGVEEGGHNLAHRADLVEEVSGILADAGAPAITWYGLRLFSDHLGDVPPGPDFDDLCELEWRAGARDPYRRLGRLFHVLARRSRTM